jgi:uncharacterized protein YbcC (UPF0753/DUF2309 family)
VAVAPTEDLRDHLRHEVEHFSHLLPPQGPISTFIHHNTLHGLQHLHFHEAIAEAERVLGGRGYLPNEEYRRLHAAGRIAADDLAAALDERADVDRPLATVAGRTITAREVERVALVHGIEPLDPGQLRFELYERDAGRRFREDVPEATRAALLEAAAQELARGLERVGRDWTLAEWVAAETGLDLPGRLRAEVAASPRGADRRVRRAGLQRLLRKLAIPADRIRGYLDCIDRQLEAALQGAVPAGAADRERLRALWLEAERRLVRALVPRHLGCRGNFAAITAHLARDLEAYAVRSLWRSSLASFALDDPLALTDPVHLTERDPNSAAEEPERPLAPGDRDERRRRVSARAQATLAEQLDGLGRGRTHCDLLSDLTGEDLGERVDSYMITLCAAFLDDGQAAWRMPERALGFYDGWRALAIRDWTFALDGLAGWREALAALPEAPEDAVIEQLEALGVPEEHWGAYLGRVITRLSGWCGMIAWRAERPHYPRQEAQPVDLVSYLAVRLFYERLRIAALCDATWGFDGSLEGLRGHFEASPSELLVRLDLHRGELPDDLATEARALAERAPGGDEQSRRWDALAEATFARREHESAGELGTRAACEGPWRLFGLAQLLGLTGAELRSLDADGRDCLLGAVDAFPAARHGPVWLTAYERHYREQILGALAANHGHGDWSTRERRPTAQVAFCIDEREEALRRHIEELDPGCETFGVAGFFGVAMNFQPLDGHETTPLCPPVVHPAHVVKEVARPEEGKRLATHESRARWHGALHGTYWEVKRNALAAYFLLDLMGPLQALPLAGRVLSPLRAGNASAALHRRLVPPVPTTLAVNADPHDGDQAPPGLQLGFATFEQADRVEATLRNIGLTDGFARLVVLTGHGSVSINNPHESAHDCGACGGKHGGPSAWVFALMANRPEVRSLLRERGIEIPADTWFIGSQHNTASELYTYFGTEDVPESHREELGQLVATLDEARCRSARERCRRFASAPKDASLARSLRHIEGRSSDLSQVRPEWGHATNAFAVVGRRSITQGLFLDRRPFLISYDPTQDRDGMILERILLAVGPVGAGINLEYYFSTVDNLRYGSDTKVPHNVTGLIGVMEGAASDLRTGLPKQMVEIHEPMRLQMVVESRLDVLGEIYGRQQGLQELLGNAWVHLIAMDPDTGALSLFDPKGEFVPWEGAVPELPVVRSSHEWYRGKLGFLPPARIEQAGEPGRSAVAPPG